MYDAESDAKPQLTQLSGTEYSAEATTRHRTGSALRRRFFFGLASIWGFIVGIAGLLAVMGASGQHLEDGLGVLPGLIPALVVAAAGSLVIAAACSESKRRAR